MAWSAPRTWATGEVVTAALMNTQVRDNLKAMAPIAYVEFTSNVTVTSTTEATPNDIVSSGAITYEARPILIEFFAPFSSNNGTLRISLWDAATNLGFIQQIEGAADGVGGCSRRLTPSAASHTYKITGYLAAGTTGTVHGEGGGAGTFNPGYIRVRYDEV